MLGKESHFLGIGFLGEIWYERVMATDTTMQFQNMTARYGDKYTRVLQRALQEDQALLQPYVTIMPGCVGDKIDIPMSDTANLVPRAERNEKITEHQEIKVASRKMLPRMFHREYLFNMEDKMFATTVDMQVSHIVTELRSAINRTMDEVALGTQYVANDGCYRKMTVASAPASPYDSNTAGGILGTNYLGMQGNIFEDLGDTDTGKKDSCVVGYNFAYTGTGGPVGATLEKIIRGIELLKKKKAYIKGKNTCVLALSSAQIAEIQLWEQAMNRNYGFGDLVNGFQNRILGINILETESLPMLDLDNNNIARICPMWVKEHVVFGVWADANIRIDPQLQNYTSRTGQVVANVAMGASRKYKEAVVQIQCLEDDFNALNRPS